jgi:hypothetical protein
MFMSHVHAPMSMLLLPAAHSLKRLSVTASPNPPNIHNPAPVPAAAVAPCSTFTEEAERHCKHAGEVLEEGLTVSGQGLVYNFDNTQYGSYKVRLAHLDRTAVPLFCGSSACLSSR